MKTLLLILSFLLSVSLSNAGESQGSVNSNSFSVNIHFSGAKYNDSLSGNYRIRNYYAFSNTGLKAETVLPYKIVLISIPANTQPNIKILSQNIITHLNTIPSFYWSGNVQELKTELHRTYDRQGLVNILGYTWLREFFCVKLLIRTHQYNLEQNCITELKSVKIELNFPLQYDFKGADTIQIKNDYDKLLKETIANYNMAEQFRNKTKTSDDTTGSWIDYNKNYLKIGTAADGLVRISKKDLEINGINTSGIDPRTFRLFQGGKEVSCTVYGEENGIFDSDEYIEFWGSKNYSNYPYAQTNRDTEDYNEYLNRYSDTCIYFLNWGENRGIRAPKIRNYLLNAVDTVNYYYITKHVEVNKLLQFMNNDETVNQQPDYKKNKTWIWEWILPRLYTYSFQTPEFLKEKSSRLMMKLISSGSSSSTNSHNVSLSVNGIKIDSQMVNRYNQAILQGEFNSAILKENNIIQLQNIPNGTNPNYLALDWYEYDYPNLIRLNKDSLLIKIDPKLDRKIRILKVYGVKDSNYVIYKIKPFLKKVEYFHILSSELVFTDTIGGNDCYIIVKPDKIKAPVYYYSYQFTNLRNVADGADYVAITHNKFWEAATNYVNWISNLYSIKTKLINVQDIFDEFSFGYPTPEGIKNYIKFAIQNWDSPKPAYLCLIGDANYDYKYTKAQNEGVKGGGNYVPSYGYPVSDNWFAVFDKDLPIPQLKVGRIPVNNPQELDLYLSKIKNNQYKAFDDWNKHFLFFSGGNASKPDELKQLKSVNDHIIETYVRPRPISGNFKHFYKTSSPLSDFGPYSSREFNDAISKGGLFISYIGHSGTATWDNSISEVDQLKNKSDRNPLITDFGCSTNKFAEPDIVSFGERFIVSPSGQALGYIGNSSLGFVSTSSTAPKYFYEQIFSDSLNEIGAAHLNSKIKLLTNLGASSVNKIFAYTNTLLGDPAVRLRIPKTPNLVIKENDIILPDQISDILDSIPASVILSNLGISTGDTICVDIEHYVKGLLIESKRLYVQLPDYSDSLHIWLNLKKESGVHSIIVKADPLNEITETLETDNFAERVFNVYSSEVRFTLLHNIENGPVKEIFLLNPITRIADSLKIIMQYSDNIFFNTYSETSIDLGTVISRYKIPELTFGKRFWIRSKLNKPEFSFSNSKSFLNRGYAIKFIIGDRESKQLQHCEYLEDNYIQISKDTVNLSVISAGWAAGANCVISKDSKNLLTNTFFAGMGIAVFDAKTMKVDTSAWVYLFNNPANMAQLVNFINNIETGKIVIMGVADDAANNITSALKNAIKTLGSTKIDQLQFRGSWALIGRKGAAPGDVIEDVKGPYDGSVYLDSTFIIQNTSGKLITKNIGPAEKWRDIKLLYEKPGDSKIDILVSGINNEGIADTLMKIPADSLVALDTLDTKKYKYIKIQTDLIAASDGTSPSISLLGVDYVGVAEIGTNYQVVSISKDSLVQGDSLGLQFGVYNVGESAADSFRVKVELLKPDNSAKLLMDSLVSRLDTMSHKDYSLLYRTGFSEGTGNMKFRISMDPENKVTELYKDNNVYETAFYVKPDTTPTSVTSASLDVTFDGISITEGDYVSANPEVKFVLSYPVWFPVNDTSAVQFYIDNKQVFHSEMDFFSDTINRKVIFKYLPLLEDGEHHLRVYGKNIIGKIENTPGYEVFFQVQNEMKLLNVYNYPNPFKTNTSFTFTLTQVPDDLRIKIFTVAGRMIREINGSSYGVHAGFNAVPWDGRDEDGNVAANGVYLYKVVVKKGERTENTIQKLAIVK